MDISKSDLKTIVDKLQRVRTDLIINQPFFAVLLMHTSMSLDNMCETAYTDGKTIAFCPDFLINLSDSELKFVIMHEILHIALKHYKRDKMLSNYDRANMAADIVVNSNILYANNMDLKSITIDEFGTSIHLTPMGEEGYKFSMEEVYSMLSPIAEQKSCVPFSRKQENRDWNSETSNEENNKSNGLGEQEEKDEEKDNPKQKSSISHNGEYEQNIGNNKINGLDGEEENDHEKQKICTSCNGEQKQKSEKNEASNEENNESNSADCKMDNATENNGKGQTPKTTETQSGRFDDHSFWDKSEEDDNGSEWDQIIITAVEIAKSCSGRGTIPLCAERMVKELTASKLDWRTILDNFIQEEINDYSFNPPDRRFQESPFLLPDYNEKNDSIKNILFMIDTSRSMSDVAITECYSEIYGAIQQFNGKLEGLLGFFDAEVVEPREFTTEDEFIIIRPEGGGGTSFSIIFDYVKSMQELPICIVILTDGYAPFPDEKEAMGIPVLWIINNEDVNPPWGMIARYEGVDGIVNINSSIKR